MLSWPRDCLLRPLTRFYTMQRQTQYESWTREELISRLRELECSEPSVQPRAVTQHSKKAPNNGFDFSAYPIRKIALKFSYAGWAYNGLAYQTSPTPLPTVEETIFKALAQTKLIDPDKGYEGCGWERCGRTDRGVSAAGQVISLWVRSTLKKSAGIDSREKGHGANVSASEDLDALAVMPELTARQDRDALQQRRSEIRYVSVLNRILPPTIRIIAWSAVSPSFSSRYSCRYRHYKYFFPAHELNLGFMREGAARLMGEHDFRNLCKLDPSKQIKSFKRTILRAEINPAHEIHNDMYVFDLAGTAFLYHQVRHIMAILFLVGTGLEPPSVISALVNTDPENVTAVHTEDGSPVEVVPCKPEYQMADALPLMLWDCAFDESEVQWQTDKTGMADLDDRDNNQSGSGSELYHQVHSLYSRSLIHTALNAEFLSSVARYHPPSSARFPIPPSDKTCLQGEHSVMLIPLGGGAYKRSSKYIPLLRRKRLEPVEVTNRRWLERKGDKRTPQKSAGLDDDADSDE